MPPKALTGHPPGANLLLKRVATVQTRGIITPETAQQVSDEVVVLAVGPHVDDVKAGDDAIVRKFSRVGSENQTSRR